MSRCPLLNVHIFTLYILVHLFLCCIAFRFLCHYSLCTVHFAAETMQIFPTAGLIKLLLCRCVLHALICRHHAFWPCFAPAVQLANVVPLSLSTCGTRSTTALISLLLIYPNNLGGAGERLHIFHFAPDTEKILITKQSGQIDDKTSISHCRTDCTLK